VFVGREVVQDQVQLLAGPAGAQDLQERQELSPSLAFPDPIDHLSAVQVEGGEHVPDPLAAVVGGTQPDGVPGGTPGTPRPWLQVHRAELIDTHHPPSAGGES
jgi:hypothetical protein